GEARWRGGPWSAEAAEIEAAYGADRTVHVSLEEFARTLPARSENTERFREGGVRQREIRQRRTDPEFDRETEEFRAAFRRFRGFDRPNVLHLFTGFHPSRAFAREIPEAVQVGPLWPIHRPRRSRSGDGRSWVWYASPASSQRLVGGIGAGLSGSGVDCVRVRSPRSLLLPSGTAPRWAALGPTGDTRWRAQMARAELRIVTGSRTLLEALQLGGPFLYFNGILGAGNRTHRHRPEKILELLRAWRSAGVARRYLRDLGDFSIGRRVAEIVRTAATDVTWRDRFPSGLPVSEYPPGRTDAGRFLIALANSFEQGADGAAALVRAVRSDPRAPRAHEE
ncbi:MAG TPA: hypothetical protein VJQ43_02160, partial [Thermoplasmata archaeon]|nr:hypothetical protein [Thermoplasmata archaeon]